MGRTEDSSFETTIELQRVRHQIGELERRVAQLEVRLGYLRPGQVHRYPMDEFPDRVRAIVREQSVILAASMFTTVILVFLIVTLAT